METIVSTLVAVFVVGWAFLAEAHEVEVVLYPTIGPVSVPSFGIVSPSFAGFAANVLNGLHRGRADFGGSILFTPTAFNTIGPSLANRSGRVKVSVYDTWASKGNSWRGLTPSNGPFANELGTHFRAALLIRSHATFTLADVNITATYSDLPSGISVQLGGPPAPPPAGGLYDSFSSNRLRGIYWGRDGKPGGGDDRIYDTSNPGSYTTPINELLFVGQGEVGFADITSSASNEQQSADFLAYLNAYAPYTFSYTYTLRGVSSTVTVVVDLTSHPGPALPPGSHHHFRPFRLYPIR